jgi:hypothetical protein
MCFYVQGHSQHTLRHDTHLPLLFVWEAADIIPHIMYMLISGGVATKKS